MAKIPHVKGIRRKKIKRIKTADQTAKEENQKAIDLYNKALELERVKRMFLYQNL